MKNSFKFFYFVFISLIICSCGSKPPADINTDGGLRIVLQPEIDDIMRTIQASDSDTIFNNALLHAKKTCGSNNNSFVDVFFSEIQKNDSLNHFLSSHFILAQNKPLSNVGCLSAIKAKVKETIEEIKKILEERINKYGVENPTIQSLKGDEKILIVLPGVKSSDRVRKLIQASANVEFWETYELEEIGDNLTAANEKLVQLLGKGNNNFNENSNRENQLLDTSSLLSKLGKINAQNDSLIAQNPLFSILNPSCAYNEKGIMQYSKGCIVGTAKIADTAKIDNYLSQPEIMLLFPKHTKFLWMFKPASHISSEMLEMVAIRTNRRGVANVSGVHITNASVTFHDEYSSPSISILMNPEGAFAWKSMSRKNIGRSIAIVADDQVYSCPVVNAEIPSGNTSLDGGFTLEEATDFANVLNAGKLPVRLRILTEETILPMSSR